MRRRHFLASLVSGAAAGLVSPSLERPAGPVGDLHGPAFATGHRLRHGIWPEPSEQRAIPLLIVGGGIAGLSAAWWLRREGYQDFRLLELESQPGGNARYGENAVSAFPWGAHYLPLPGVELPWVRLLLADLGVLLGDPAAPEPRYDERHLCFAPQERLFLRGAWQDGVLPKRGVSRRDHEQYRRFFAQMDDYRQQRGTDGLRAFALPMAESSQDQRWRNLDRGSMREWLLAEGYDSPYLHWYVNYACRDDFGCDYRETSAWAGVHYFTSRTGGAEEARDGTVLTWPEGNGWIVRRLVERLQSHIECGHVVFRVGEQPDGVSVDSYEVTTQRVIRWRAEQVIWAAPSFLLPRVCPSLPEAARQAAASLDYAPWLVANLTLNAFPELRDGVPLAWDNVLYNSPGLGYVVATHQAWRARQDQTVLTYYRPLTEMAPTIGRRLLLERSGYDWAESILADLSRPHPEIADLVERLDMWRWGHAMARPVPGFLAAAGRDSLASGWGRIHPAHSDLSGLSLFEEAQYRGIVAVRRALGRVV